MAVANIPDELQRVVRELELLDCEGADREELQHQIDELALDLIQVVIAVGQIGMQTRRSE